MKAKILNFIDYDFGNIMDTFVFKDDANIEEIKETVEKVFEDEGGQRPYCNIINEWYGDLMLQVIETHNVQW